MDTNDQEVRELSWVFFFLEGKVLSASPEIYSWSTGELGEG